MPSMGLMKRARAKVKACAIRALTNEGHASGVVW